MVQIVNIETYSDADFVRRYVYQTVGKVPIDLGSGVLRMMIRSNAADVTAHIDLTSQTSGILITDAAGGAFTLTIPVTLLATLVPGVYVHSMILTDANYQTRKDVWRGTLTHRAGPTRWKQGTLNP